MPTPLESMRIVARRLEPLNIPFAFLGGAAVCLLVDHPELTEFRPTKDVEDVLTLVDGRASVVPGDLKSDEGLAGARGQGEQDACDCGGNGLRTLKLGRMIWHLIGLEADTFLSGWTVAWRKGRLMAERATEQTPQGRCL